MCEYQGITSNGITPSPVNGLSRVTALHHPRLVARVLRGRGHGQLSPIPQVLGKWHNVMSWMRWGWGQVRLFMSALLSTWPPAMTEASAVAHLSTRWQHSLALFLFLFMENFTHCRHCQGTLNLGFPFHVLTTIIVLFGILLSSVQLQFILPLWDLGKGRCKEIAVIISVGRVILIRCAYTYTHPTTVLGMNPAMI